MEIGPVLRPMGTTNAREVCGNILRGGIKPTPYGITFLDDATDGGYLPTEFTVIGAETGAGKTTLATLLSRLGVGGGKRILFIALEAFEGEIHSRLQLMEAAARGLIGREITIAQWMQGKHGIDPIKVGQFEDSFWDKYGDHTLRVCYRKKRTYIEHVIDAIETHSDWADVIILDHLHFVDHHKGTSSNEAIAEICQEISALINLNHTPVIGIAHFRKRSWNDTRVISSLHDFHGSSEITKVATTCIILASSGQVGGGVAGTYMSIVKSRYGNRPVVTKVGYDLTLHKYANFYTCGRVTNGEFVEMADHEAPEWAKHHKDASL